MRAMLHRTSYQPKLAYLIASSAFSQARHAETINHFKLARHIYANVRATALPRIPCPPLRSALCFFLPLDPASEVGGPFSVRGHRRRRELSVAQKFAPMLVSAISLRT